MQVPYTALPPTQTRHRWTALVFREEERVRDDCCCQPVGAAQWYRLYRV